MSKLILITNPGSASRKYALYDGDDLMAQFHFEYEGKKVVCTIKDVDDGNKKITPPITHLNDAITILPKILNDEAYVTGQHKLEAVVVRIVAPGDYFTEDHVVDEEYMQQLDGDLYDYKFLVYGGKVKNLFIVSDRFNKKYFD